MDEDTPHNPLSPKDEKSEAALRALCAEAGVDYEPPSEAEQQDPALKTNRRQRLRKRCKRKRTPVKRSDEDRAKDAKRKREERQVEKHRQENDAREREIQRAALELMRHEYGAFLLARCIAPRLPEKRATSEIVDITQAIIEDLRFGKVTVSTHSVIPYENCGDESCEGFEDLRVEAPYENDDDENYKTIRRVGVNQKKILHLEQDSAQYHWMKHHFERGRRREEIRIKAIKCLHPARWNGELKYFSNLVSVTDLRDKPLRMRASERKEGPLAGHLDFHEHGVFPWKEVCTATDEDEGYVICGYNETDWFGIDQGLLKEFNLSSRRIAEIITGYVCHCKYEQLEKQFVVSTFPTHDSVDVDDRAIMPCGNSYHDVKRKYLRTHHRKLHDEAMHPWSKPGDPFKLTMTLYWPRRELLSNGYSPMRTMEVDTERYLNSLVPIYENTGLICNDRHFVISPVGRLSVKDWSQKGGFCESSLDEVRIPDSSGHHNATTTSVRAEDITSIENGYIHHIGKGYQKDEPRYFQVTGPGGLPVFAYGDLRGGRHVIHPAGVFATGYFSDEDEFGLSNTEDDYMFSIEMQTKLGGMTAEELQALELHINGSNVVAALTESSCRSSIDQSRLKLCYKWDSLLDVLDEGCWVKLDLEIDISRCESELFGEPSGHEDVSLERLPAGRTLSVNFTTISFTINMMTRGGDLHAIALEDYNKSREGNMVTDKDVDPEATKRNEEVQQPLKISNSPPCEADRAQLRFSVGQYVDCWVSTGEWHSWVNGRVVEQWSRVANRPAWAGWAGRRRARCQHWAPYKVEVSDGTGFHLYVPFDEDDFILASIKISPDRIDYKSYRRRQPWCDMKEFGHTQIKYRWPSG